MKRFAIAIAIILGLIASLYIAAGAKPGSETDYFQRLAGERK